MFEYSWHMGLLFLFGFTACFALVPVVKRVARAWGLVAVPGGHNTHADPTPLLGGIAIFLPLAAVICAVYSLASLGPVSMREAQYSQMLSLLLAAAWMLILGTVDDKYKIRWRSKLAGQIAGALLLVWGGHTISVATLPLFGVVDFGWAGMPLFVIAVVAITNAINLIDGIDGLAGGICFFAGLTCGIIGLAKGDLLSATIGFTVSGSLLAFLVYNFPPASIFMGDGGSMMLGTVLGTLAVSQAAIQPGQRLATSAVIIVPLLPFGIPLFEVGLSIGRRWLRGQAIFLGDGDHLHHRVREKTRNPRLTAIIFYLFTATFCTLTLLLVLRHESLYAKLFVVILGIVLFVGLLASLRLYKFSDIFNALRNRPHFKFLGTYLPYMTHKMVKAQSADDLLELLASGVTDLAFDSVEVRSGDRVIARWTNPTPVHPTNRRIHSERTFEHVSLCVAWERPEHNDAAYNEYLRLTWHRFLEALEPRIEKLALPDKQARDADRVIKAGKASR